MERNHKGFFFLIFYTFYLTLGLLCSCFVLPEGNSHSFGSFSTTVFPQGISRYLYILMFRHFCVDDFFYLNVLILRRKISSTTLLCVDSSQSQMYHIEESWGERKKKKMDDVITWYLNIVYIKLFSCSSNESVANAARLLEG